jgi:hypothetical protein
MWSKYSNRLRESVDALGIIGFTQAYPVILAALEKFARPEMERLLRLIECVAVRHQLIGRRRPGRVESLGGRAAKDIFEGRVTTATEVLALIRELYVPDDEFRLSFESIAETSSRKARYLLTGIERQSIERDGKTFADELTPNNVTMEHIFPRSPSDDWKASVHDDLGWDPSLITRLGNLCLLPGVNQSLGNKPWSEKAIIYEKSRLNGTNRLTQYAKWGSVEIIQRQKFMAQLAVTAWRFQ